MKTSEIKNYAENKCAAYGAQLIDTNDDQLIRSLIQIYRKYTKPKRFLIKDNGVLKLVQPTNKAVEAISTNYKLTDLFETSSSRLEADIICTKSPIYATEMLSPDAKKLDLDFLLTRDNWRSFKIGNKSKIIKYTGNLHGAWTKSYCEALNSTVILPQSETENNNYQKIFRTLGLPPWIGLSLALSDSLNLHDGLD